MKPSKLIEVAAWGLVVVAASLMIGVSGFLSTGRQQSAAEGGATTIAMGEPFELTTHYGQTFTNAKLPGSPIWCFLDSPTVRIYAPQHCRSSQV